MEAKILKGFRQVEGGEKSALKLLTIFFLLM